MRLTPRLPAPSLMARSFALIAVLMLFSVLAWLALYTHFEREPKTRQLSHWVITSVNLVRPALVNAAPEKRLDLLLELAQKEDIRIYPADAQDSLSALPDSALIRTLQQKIRAALGADTRFASAVDDTPGFWVSFAIHPGDEYWLRLPMEHVLPHQSITWIGWAAAALLLALGGAWAAVAHVTRPLARLSHAALAVARGHTVPQLDERGPLEIARVAVAFNQMARTLQSIDADRAFSLAGVSHDLRTPLTRLHLEIELSSLDEPTRAAMIADLDDMNRIIGQFIDYARGLDDEPLSSVALDSLIEDIVESFRQRGETLELERGPAPFSGLPGKPLALRRAISNLIHNALQYGDRTQAPVIQLFALENGLQIDILDRGPGISPDQADALKQAFVRGDAARSNARGAGLGLAIVDRIARAHGGDLSLLPRPGGGLIARLVLRGFCAP